MEIVERLVENGADPTEIERLEERVGKLPPDFREFLLRINGGRPDPAGFSFQAGPRADESDVDWFFALGQGSPYEILHSLEVYRDRIPMGLLPIASDPGGNLLLLSLRRDDFGSVFFWDHEEESPPNPTMSNAYLVASSFSAFIADLFD